jgi:hypothetical protein
VITAENVKRTVAAVNVIIHGDANTNRREPVINARNTRRREPVINAMNAKRKNHVIIQIMRT